MPFKTLEQKKIPKNGVYINIGRYINYINVYINNLCINNK